MKKIKIIIPLIIAFMLGISTTVTATTIFNSKDITYSNEKTEVTNVKDSLDELYSKLGKCPEGKWCYNEPKTMTDRVELGDYIIMTPTTTSYAISKDLTGYSSDQTINPSELNLWRVIKKNEDGTIEMASEYVSNEKIYFSGKTGYINFIGALNTIASQYTNDKYVAKTRHIGYSNQTQTITDISLLSKTSPPWDGMTCKFWTCTESGFTETQEKQGAGDIGYMSDYKLVNPVFGTMKSNDLSGKTADYWLASRHYNKRSDSEWWFVGRRVDTFGEVNGYRLYYYNNGFEDITPKYAIRPILTLKSNVEIKSGDGKSASTAYQLK